MTTLLERKNLSMKSGILDMMIDLQGTRIYHYLKSKGIYNSKIDWINYCFELDSKENQKKSAPYDWVVATVKALKGMGIEPVYELTKSGKYIRNLDELESSDKKEVAAELKDGWLKQWMTIFFQENPQADLSKKFNFEQLTYNYVRYIETFDKTEQLLRIFTLPLTMPKVIVKRSIGHICFQKFENRNRHPLLYPNGSFCSTFNLLPITFRSKSTPIIFWNCNVGLNHIMQFSDLHDGRF